MIVPVDFIDASAMAASLVLQQSHHFRDDTRRQKTPGSPHHDTEVIVLRAPLGIVSRETWFSDCPHEDMPLLETWPHARLVIEAIANSHARRAGRLPEFGKIMVTRLKPGGTIDWHVDTGEYANAYDRFHLCLVPSSGAVLYSGINSLMLQMGTLAFFENHIMHSAVNFGTVPRDHLVVDIRRPVEAIPKGTLQ